MYTCTYMRLYEYIYIYDVRCICMYIYIYTYMYIYVHIEHGGFLTQNGTHIGVSQIIVSAA